MDAPKSLAEQLREIEQSYPPISEDLEIKKLDAALSLLDAQIRKIGRAEIKSHGK